MVDIAPILEEAERRLSTSSVKERVGIFEASLASAIDQQDNNFPERAGEVVSLIFKTLPLYTDRRSQSSVERAIVKALKRDSAFVKTFTGGLIQYTSKSGKTAGADVQLKLLKWSCLLLRTNPDLFSVKAAFARLAGAQAVLLTGLLKSAVRIQRSALHAFLQLLNQVAPAFELYMGEVKATPVTFDSIGMVSALLSHCTSSSSSSPSSSAAAGADGTSSLLDGTKGAFLEIYIKAVLSSKEKPPVEASRAFKPLLQRLGHDEFAATVVPTAVRMLKRNPELVMEAVGYLVATVSIDLSKYGGEFLPTLLQQARQSDEGKRRDAAAVVRSLALQSSDWDALAAMFDSMAAILRGSEGKLTFPYQRSGMLAAVLALSAAPGGRAAVPLACTVSTFLMGAYKDEMNEEAKVAGLGALGAWLARTGAQAPAPQTPTFFAAALKEKESLRRAALRCLRQALQNRDMGAQLASLAEPLVQLAKAGLTKPAQRVEGIYALLLAASIAADDIAAEDIMSKEKMWPLIFQKDCPLFSASLVAKLSAAEDALALVDLADVLLLHHTSRSTQNPEGTNELAQLVVSLMWHSVWDVRKAAHAVAARCHVASPVLSVALLDAFCNWLPVLADRQSAAAASDATEAAPDPNVPLLPAPELVAKALVAVVAPAMAEKAGVCGRLLLAAHHPCVVAGQHKSTVWKALLKSTAKKGADMTATLASDASIVCKILLGPGGLVSTRKEQAAAAVSAIATAMQTFPAEFFPHLFPALEALGDRTAHDELTERDIKIHFTEEGVLSTEDGVYVAEAVRDKNVRRGRGRMKMYDDGLEEEVEPVRPSMAVSSSKTSGAGKKDAASKPGGKKSDADKAKTGKELAREEQLREEAGVRAEVQVIRERQALVLQALGAAAHANPFFAHDELPALVEFVLPLLKSPLVASEAYATMLQLAACVAPSLQPLSADLASALCMVVTSAAAVHGDLKPHTTETRGGAGKVRQGVVERVVLGIVASCKQGPLPAASFGAIFPIVEQILLAPSKTRVHDDLIQVIALHTSPYIALPRRRMIAVLYHVLGVVPVLYDRVLPLLRELCKGLHSDELLQALSGLYAEQAHVRAACLDAVQYVPAVGKGQVAADPALTALLWLAQYDPDKDNAETAEVVWDMYGHELGTDYAPALLTSLAHPHMNVREAAAEALAAAMDENPTTIQATLSALFSMYMRDIPRGFPGEDPTWRGREGVALALQAASDVLSARDLPVVATFLISKALADLNANVRSRMVSAGAAIINKHGRENVGLLLPIFENYLDKKATDEERYDLVREGVVVFLGALAKHFDSDDPKVGQIVQRLLEVLNTPSESVQRAVSNCLPPLMASRQADAQALVARLLGTMMSSDKYGERRGAAFGLAGVVKGLGLSAFKKYGIMDALKRGLEDKVSPKAREGALLGFECLCEKIGRLFEPYVIHILPLLLVCFSDAVVAVREAADGAARAIMGQLTGQGVKLVLPALLTGLEDRAWRTKQGSVQLLGAMAFCAPRQLSQCLPTIVPNLTEVLTDTHPKVQAAAQTALQQVGSVIRNPEIASLVPSLLVGIADPNEHTRSSLDLLLQTTFVNTVDAPSLALLVPIVHRGLRERSSETKKKAAQIVGNMCSLVSDPKDMLPYRNLLLPELRKVLVDPHPEVRTVAARALGSLVRGLGQDNFQDLVPWLLTTIKSDTASVERSGAAQGLSEVVAALGKAHFEALLPDIIANCSHARASVRDGYLTLFKFLPSSLGAMFQKHLPVVLPAILDGLADENESVREAALAAGHVLVEHYATSALPLLLPAVEEGIFSDNWRIRQSSVELLGDLLFKVAGTSGKVVLEGGSDDEGASTEAHGQAIINILGRERRNAVLAAVYVVRSDVSLSVRQAALHVWKTIVVNTPKTLKEIMPVLMSTLISALGSSSFERRQVAGRSLGELVRKLGDRVLPSIIPILARGLGSDSGATRQGVCIGLSEVMGNTGKQQLASYMPDLIPTIRNALCDSEADVREAAGQAFNTLYKNAGLQAVDEIVPALLHALEDPKLSATALDGLKQILSVRTAAVLPHILPKLVQPPITAFNAHALGALAKVAGPGLNAHLSTVLPPFLAAVGDASEDNAELAEVARSAAETVVAAVDEDGLDALISEFMGGLSDSSPETRRGAAALLGYFCRSTRLDLEDEVPGLLSTLIILLTDPDEGVVKASWEALGSVTGTVPKENLASLLKTVRDAIGTARDRERRKRKGSPILIPGLCLPKALQPLLQVYLQGLMSGSAELREQAADGLGEIIDVTSEAALRPFVVPITGPLIRIIGDRFPWQVKSSILGTLSIIIAKGGIALKPFLPQLQTTFVKCLQDNNRLVRSRAAKALGRLTRLNPRVDPLVGDLLTAAQNAEGGVKEAMLVALKGVMQHAGKGVGVPTLLRLQAALSELLPADEDEIRALAGRALGISSQFLGDAEFESLLQGLASPGGSQAWAARHGSALALSSLLRHASVRVSSTPGLLALVQTTLKARAKDDKVPVRDCAAKGIGRLLRSQVEQRGAQAQSLAELLPVLAQLLADDASDARRRALSALKALAKVKPDVLVPYWPKLAPHVANCLKDSSQPVRMAAERTALHLFQLPKGADAVQAAQKYITGLDARRIAKLQELSDASEDSEGEGIDS